MILAAFFVLWRRFVRWLLPDAAFHRWTEPFDPKD